MQICLLVKFPNHVKIKLGGHTFVSLESYYYNILAKAMLLVFILSPDKK